MKYNSCNIIIYLTDKLLHQKEIHLANPVKTPQMLFNFILGMYDFQFRHIRIQDMCLDLWPRHRNLYLHIYISTLHFVQLAFQFVTNCTCTFF